MENQSAPNLQDPQQANNTPAEQTPAVKQKINLLWSVLITLFISAVVFGFGGYYFGKQTASFNQFQPTPVTTLEANNPSPTSAAVVEEKDEIAGWKTYSNSDKNFSFRYPTDWTVENSDNSDVFLKIIKHLPENSVDERYCRPGIMNGGTDCYPEVWIELSSAPKPNDYISIGESSLSNAFGESLNPEKEEFVKVNGMDVKLDYLRKDSYYPSYSFVDLQNEILRFKAYAPTSKNCIGACPNYDDSQIVKDSAEEIKTIIFTFKLLTN